MISKELLSEVLGEIQEFSYLTDGIYYCLLGDFDEWHTINIYELAHKCKEWALRQGARGYSIDSVIKSTKGYARVGWYEKNHKDQHGQYREHQFYSEWFEADDNSEPEAIFYACEWIRNET